MRVVEIGSASRTAAAASMTNKPRRMGNWLKGLSIILIGSLFTALFAAEPQGVVLVGAGSSVPLPLYRKWADLYNQNNKTVQLQYVPMGTVEGIAQITHGTSDFGAGEIPLTAQERP